MQCKAWRSMEEVPCYFRRSYVKFQGHTQSGIKSRTLRTKYGGRNWTPGRPRMSYLHFRKNKALKRLIFQAKYFFDTLVTQLKKFFWSSTKFQGHMGWKINDFNPIWVRLLGWSQLSNPSDLPCFHQQNPASQWVPENTRQNMLTHGPLWGKWLLGILRVLYRGYEQLVI